MNDEPKELNSNDERAYQFALTELLVEKGVINPDEFKDFLDKWRKSLGVESKDDPLAFLKENVKPVTETFDVSPDKNKILIVDDMKLIRDMIKKALTLQGYDIVAEAENGKVGLEMFVEHRPDYVLLDINMKDMDGLEALRLMREIDRNTPIIMVTGNPVKEFVDKALKLGMSDFIVKPIDMNRLLAVLQKYQQAE